MEQLYTLHYIPTGSATQEHIGQVLKQRFKLSDQSISRFLKGESVFKPVPAAKAKTVSELLDKNGIASETKKFIERREEGSVYIKKIQELEAEVQRLKATIAEMEENNFEALFDDLAEFQPGSLQGKNTTQDTLSPRSSNSNPIHDAIYCAACGTAVHSSAKSCPACGAAIGTGSTSGKRRNTALWLAALLGGVGAHKFYMGYNGLGVLYLLFVWTGIPLIASIVEFFIYLFSSEEEFEKKVAPTLRMAAR